TGENVWKNDSGYFFFTHTFLWGFLPWSILAVFALFENLKDLIKTRLKKAGVKEVLTISGFVLPFLALSMSKYKLPHYIFVVFPMAAIFTAAWVVETLAKRPKALKSFQVTQFIVALLLAFAITFLVLISFPGAGIFNYIVLATIFILVFYFIFK